MQLKTVIRAALPILAGAAAFGAAEVWNTKVSSVWTEADANLILNNSPWAKQVKTKTQAGAQRVMRPGRSGGMGRRGGIGYPGGGYPGGGGGGWGGAGQAPMNVLVRWESARPVQEAEARLKSLHSPPDAKTESHAAGFQNHYVVTVIGLRAAGGRDGGGSRQVRDQLLTTTQLVIKNRAPIGPDDVKVISEGGSNQIEFFFPRDSPISAADKEVTFHSVIGRMTVENKFQLKAMTRNRKLELD
jgi:hypothetical protein